MKLMYKIIIAFFIGIFLSILIFLGNPGNMGICSICFVRDIAGALGLHSFQLAQYIRPEIIGVILGSAVLAILRKKFVGLSGSISIYKFIFGFWMSVGALVFLGCPFRLLQRLGGGDGTAIFGAIGFTLGVGLGMIFEKYGYLIPESLPSGKHIAIQGIIFAIILLLLLTLLPTGLHISTTGIGSTHAPTYISLIIGTVVGGLLQLTGFCTVSMVRGIFVAKKRTFLYMSLSLIIGYAVTSLITGKFNIGFLKQPAAHNDYLWNIISMILVGLAGVLVKGCPMRQIVMTGEGNSDALSAVLGMVVGTAISHNFLLVSTPTGASPAGKIMVIVGLIFCSMVAIMQILYVKKLQYKEIVSRY